MKVLTLNCGSSSIKFQVMDTDAEKLKQNESTLLAKGLIEKIGLSDSMVNYEAAGRESVREITAIFDHIDALRKMVQLLTTGKTKVLDQVSEIEAVGHRIVHGGETFSDSIVIDAKVEQEIEGCIEFAPLHNPHNLKGYRVAKQIFGGVPHVAVFDTAFHQNMPDYAYIYALPYLLYQKYRIRRYGFHGSSHRYVSYRAAALMAGDRADFKMITAHLGNGCSICAIDRGKSVDTSMGFTPVEGLVMGTRGGDMDPAIILNVMAREELTVGEADALLNKHSGLYGISGETSDLREIIKDSNEGDDRARLAVDIFCYRLKKYIASYMGVLGGADAVVFTGGIGENSSLIREKSTSGLECMGITVDREKNRRASGSEKQISVDTGAVKVFVIPTNEEFVIARDTVRCVSGLL